MIKKILNFGKKSNGYYLELDESVKDAVESTTQTIKEKVTETTEVVKDKITETKETVTEKSASVQEAVKDKVESGSETSENKKSTNKEKKETTTASATPANSGASSYEPPFWVKVMYENNSTSKKVESEQTFATDYLMPTITKTRRRPGGSLKKFKEMASQTKTPKF